MALIVERVYGVLDRRDLSAQGVEDCRVGGGLDDVDTANMTCGDRTWI